MLECEELADGADAYQAVISKEAISRDPVLNTAVREVGERIAAVAERPDYDWEFAVLENPEVANAFALPDGKVAVYSGLFPIAKDSAGLAAVLGHEVAHAIARHGAEQLTQKIVIDGLTGGISSAFEVPGLQFLAGVAIGMGVHVGYKLPFSRAQESEADHIGIILMAKAGYDPREILGLWERFEAAQKQAPIEFLSTHPNPGTRREDLLVWLPEAQAHFDASQAAPVRELATHDRPILKPSGS